MWHFRFGKAQLEVELDGEMPDAVWPEKAQKSSEVRANPCYFFFFFLWSLKTRDN